MSNLTQIQKCCGPQFYYFINESRLLLHKNRFFQIKNINCNHTFRASECWFSFHVLFLLGCRDFENVNVKCRLNLKCKMPIFGGIFPEFLRILGCVLRRKYVPEWNPATWFLCKTSPKSAKNPACGGRWFPREFKTYPKPLLTHQK